jgi:type I restriction enzyme S subunit
MISALKPYPAMKDSGVPWLGEVPGHWDLIPNRAFMRRRKSLVGKRHFEYRLLSLTKEGVIVRDVESGKGKFSADMGTFQEVHNGDLVFCLFDVPETPRTVGLSHHDGMITGAYTVFECSDPVLSTFLDHFYRAMDDRKLLSPLYSGLRHTIPPTRFLGTKTPLPPTSEQIAIVRYLDYMDRRIRKYIRVKQKLIALLNEQKQAIIHRAVTRGLNPNVRLKPSGVEWLGDVPEHWEIKRLRYLVEGKLTYGANAAAEHINPEWPRYLRITDFGSDGTLRSETFRSLPPEIAEEYLVRPGDVLLARSGATVGKAYIVPIGAGMACHAGYLIRARPRPSVIEPDFLFAFTQSAGFAMWKDSTFIIATIQNIGADKYADLPVPVPPRQEQLSITRFLQEATGKVSIAKERAERGIDLLREYRTRLIADVVTGKLDVCAAAANLPDEAGEPEILDETEDLPQAAEEEGAYDDEQGAADEP